jgi:DNA-binding transcriptional LysR family regulator
MDRLDELQVLVAILDGGSLAAASRRLRRSAPAVTRTLAALEARVGARLVERTTRRLTPTEAGRRLADAARQVLGGYADAIQAQDTAISGLLRITAPLVFGRRHVVPVALQFQDRHPAVRVEFVLSDQNLDLTDESLDAAVRIGQLNEAGLVARRLGEVRRVLVASPIYLSRRGTPATPRDLARHDTVFVSSRPRPPEWRLRTGGRTAVLRLTPALVINDVESGLVAARAGRGIANFFSYQVADDLAAGTLVRILPGNEPPPLPVSLVLGPARHRPPRVRAFADFAGTALGAALAILSGVTELAPR